MQYFLKFKSADNMKYEYIGLQYLTLIFSNNILTIFSCFVII